jgi:hypothetical protein
MILREYGNLGENVFVQTLDVAKKWDDNIFAISR